MSTDGPGAKTSYMEREQLIGKPVISSTGMITGSVKDIAAGVDGKVRLHVTRKTASGNEPEEITISSDEIQALGDVVLLKPVGSSFSAAPISQAQQPTPPPFPISAPLTKACSRCGYVNGANSRFCIKCGTSLQ
jgi:sporulation protein YlmC with PRC-barrel domain